MGEAQISAWCQQTADAEIPLALYMGTQALASSKVPTTFPRGFLKPLSTYLALTLSLKPS